MGVERDGLPEYSAACGVSPKPKFAPIRRPFRRSRGVRLVALTCLLFIAFAQWRQLRASPSSSTRSAVSLSIERLRDDHAVCSKLRHKPKDPAGLGRDRNARYIDGHKPTLIRNATVWVGEPEEGTTAEQARSGNGYSWATADVLIEYGLIKKVASHMSTHSLPKDCQIWDAKGRQLTSGIIDMHSHAGVGPLPDLTGSEDTNELSDDITPYVRSIDGIDPLDPQIQVIKSGGVTTSLVLPGSGNNIGGEAYVIKHAVGKRDGRDELGAFDMLADPDRNWRYMKMACGENAKRIYGKIARGPFSRLGESWFFRHAFEQAAKLVRDQDDWCDEADAVGIENMSSYLPQELKWESLGAALRGQVHINTHCYTVPDLEAFVDHTNEFKFPVRAFHHAHQTFLVPEILKRAWGGKPPASALFADTMYYKAEAYVGSEYAGKILWESGLDPVYVSDNPVLNAQHVVFEAAKAYKYGLPYHAALASVTSTPAHYLGFGERLGKIKPGFDADIVVWDSDPLSVGVQVWIDGTAQYETPTELSKPLGGPIVPDERLSAVVDDPVHFENVVVTGVRKTLLSGEDVGMESNTDEFAVVISKGEISCIGQCHKELEAAFNAGHKSIRLEDGYITDSFTAFGSQIGLNEIAAEDSTDNGPSRGAFGRGVDGLALDNKKLKVAGKYGITKAISAPTLEGGFTHWGTSVGFHTGAIHALEKDAVWMDDVAAHYTLTLAAKTDKTPSLSGAAGALRHLLLEAVTSNETISDPYSEKMFMRKVVAGEMPLVLTIHSADMIATALKIKATVESEIKKASRGKSPRIRLVILGGAESHLVADELAAAEVGVVLAPLLPYGVAWDQRRSLTGAPLTNGTAMDVLIRAGVTTAIGLEEDSLIRDLALLAGVAYENSGGRLSEKEAMNLISTNVYKMLGISRPDSSRAHFVVSEGSPLEIGSRIKAVGSGKGTVAVFG